MTKQTAHERERRAVLNKPRCERVAKRMKADFFSAVVYSMIKTAGLNSFLKHVVFGLGLRQ